MGSVYSARDTLLERNVALKVLSPTAVDPHGSGPDRIASVARMVREARAAAALEHPNIVSVYDVGELPREEQGAPSCFIAMELVEGLSLRECVGDQTIALETRVEWLIVVARAVAFAHARGIIHRDIKPDNVMIRNDGVVKVLDFGLARRARDADPVSGSEVLPTLTEEGKVLGTPRYMAPEQMRGAVLDGRADQFSWGVVAYEILSGRFPWPAGSDSIQTVAQMLTNEPLPIRDLVPSLSPDLARIVHRAMARDKDDRFASMDALIKALETAAVRDTAGSHAPPHPAPDARLDVRAGSQRTARRQPTIDVKPQVATRGRSPWSLAVAATAIGAVVAAGAWSGRAQEGAAAASRACVRDTDCGANKACVMARCEDRRPCRSSSECTAARGVPSICRGDACVELDSEDCHVVGEDGDIQSDATVWLGAMFPFSGEEATSFGQREFAAVDLARSDFARMLSGTNARAGGSGAHRLAIVACDDSIDAGRAARHLVDDVGVPAVIGFRTSQEIIDLATSLFIPRGVLAISALNTSPVLASLPRIPGQPRMVFRTTYSSALAAAPIALFVSQVLEPEIRAELGAGPPVPLRVALVRQEDPAGAGFGDALFRELRFNGRSALRNDANFREIPYAFETGEGKEPDFDRIAEALRAFAPHVVIHFGSDEAFLRVVDPLERSWRADAPRPRYVKPTALAPSVLQYVAGSGDRLRRFFGLTSASTTQANARFVSHYSAQYPDEVTRTFAPNSSYDAFYVLAYATFAVGSHPVTGASLARAIQRLVPPGRPIDVGPGPIFEALNALSSGERIDLNGATGRLDFDTDTGDAPIDLAILCVEASADGSAATMVESGLTYDATGRSLRGALHCR